METLKKNYEFKKVLSKGKIVKGNFIDVYYIKKRYKQNRVGFAIQKKLGNSVARNHVKRILRESYRFFEEQIIDCFDMVFVWKKNVPLEEVSFHKINQDMETIFLNSLFVKEEK